MKSTIFFLFYLLSYPIFCADAQIPTKGLLARYQFDGNVEDISGHGVHGENHGARPTADRFGRANRAILLDGASYVSLPPTPLIRDEFTWSVWVLVRHNPAKSHAANIISFGDETRRHQSLGIINEYRSNMQSGWTSGGMHAGTRETISLTGKVMPMTDTWYYLVVTRSAEKLVLYINGDMVDLKATKSLKPYRGDPMHFHIGTRSSVMQFFDGKVDDLRIYDHGLSAAEVHALFDAEKKL